MKTAFRKLTVAALAAGAAMLTLAPMPEALAKRFCLLVAVQDYPGDQMDLRFPKTDAKNFYDFLKAEHGFKEEEFGLLLDKDATKQNILGALYSIAEQMNPEDVFVLYYSGHGSQAPDYDGDERDGLDELIVNYDFNETDPNSWTTDDDLRAAMSKFNTERALVVMDCCHSGTITRSAINPAKLGIKRWTPIYSPGPQEPTRGMGAPAMRNVTRSDLKHTLIAGCLATESSFEHGEIGGGFLTLGLIQSAVQQGGEDLPLTQLQDGVRGLIHDWVSTKIQAQPGQAPPMQTPQFEGLLTVSLKQLLEDKSGVPNPNSVVHMEIVTPPQAQPLAEEAREVVLNVATDKQEYKAGDLMNVTVNADRDCYLRLYYTDQDGLSYLIFPNKFHPEDRVKGGQAVVVPGNGNSFAFRMTFPENFGGDRVGEIITAVASTQPFTDSNRTDWGNSVIVEIPGATRGSLATRGIRVEQRPGLATIAYTITKN